MRWTRQRRRTGDVAADGEVVRSWRPDADVKVAEMIRKRRRQNSPVAAHEGNR
jgi:GH24 family phage-related lysozyme (muramidase)